MASDLDREDLVERARAGDRAALTALFVLDQPRLARLVELRIEPSLRRRIDPDDVVQEAWIDAQARFDGWRVRAELPFRVWLRLVAVEALTRAHRRHLGTPMRDALREVRVDSRSSISAAAFAEAFAASQTTPTQAVRREEVRLRALEALAELDAVDREIVTLRHFEGLTNEEAAAELAIDPSAASKRFVRALVRLRPALKSLESDGGAAR